MIPITLFFFGISLSFALIARKIWQFRSGRIVPGSYEPADWTELSVESVRMRLAELAKFAVHHIVLFALRVWIVVSNWVRATDRKIKDRLTHLLHRNGHLPEGGSPSRFLHLMHKQKEKIAHEVEGEFPERTK